MKKILFYILSLIILGSCYQNTSENFSIVKKYNHDGQCFTQGFELYDGYVYESCGLFGKSYIQKYRLGEEIKISKKAEKKYFYEGLTVFKNKVYLLTWKSGEVKILDTETLEFIETKQLPKEIGEGWGITNDGIQLYISNGTNTLFIVDSNLNILDKFSTNISNINELEYQNEKIYANIWKSPKIIVFSTNTKTIIEQINLEQITKNYNGEQVLNGIMFSPDNEMIITGKMWNEMYKLQLN